MPKNRNTLFIILFSGAMLIAACVVFAYVFAAFFFEQDLPIGDSVAVVDITGEIFYDQAKVNELDDYRDNNHVKAVIININSPGGGVAASQELYYSVLKLRSKKPVVASLGELAASGGYYVACAADSIVAHEGTITGSIGVIATFLRTQELYQKIGLDMTVIKSGKYKDVGSPHRKMTDEEKEYIGSLLDQVYRQFIRAVGKNREMTEGEVLEIAEGRIFSGEAALANGLVDKLGTFEDAVNMAAGMAGIEGRPKIVKKRKRKSMIERLLGESAVRIPIMGRGERIAVKYIVP